MKLSEISERKNVDYEKTIGEILGKKFTFPEIAKIWVIVKMPNYSMGGEPFLGEDDIEEIEALIFSLNEKLNKLEIQVSAKLSYPPNNAIKPTPTTSFSDEDGSAE